MDRLNNLLKTKKFKYVIKKEMISENERKDEKERK